MSRCAEYDALGWSILGEGAWLSSGRDFLSEACVAEFIGATEYVDGVFPVCGIEAWVCIFLDFFCLGFREIDEEDKDGFSICFEVLCLCNCAFNILFAGFGVSFDGFDRI